MSTVKKRPWHSRLQWGVQFTNADGDTELLFSGWEHRARLSRYPGEPSRALLFTTRKTAAAWCQEKRKKFHDRTDHLKKWRFTPVRVRESFEVIK